MHRGLRGGGDADECECLRAEVASLLQAQLSLQRQVDDARRRADAAERAVQLSQRAAGNDDELRVLTQQLDEARAARCVHS
jgi:hypothetical protein